MGKLRDIPSRSGDKTNASLLMALREEMCDIQKNWDDVNDAKPRV